MKEQKLSFDGFDAISAKQWKQKIQADLKGADYNETLVWQSPEGIDVKPFYHPDDLPKEPIAVPGLPADWSVCQAVFVDDEAVAGRIAREALEKGAESIRFSADKPFSVEKLCEHIPVADHLFYFELNFISDSFIKNLARYFKDSNATLFVENDIIGHLARTGNWHKGFDADFETLGRILPEQNDRVHVLGVDNTPYQNAGAHIVQQLTYALAQADEYFGRMDWAKEKNTRLFFVMAVGGNYFFEIAKLRALRILYTELASGYGFPEDCHILAVPTRRDKTLYDYNINMLRTTTQCMSAALGGADAICNLAYDALYHKSNAFGERMARNQLLILKNESRFHGPEDPAGGSYYIEQITAELCTKSRELLENIRAGGGLLKQLKKGVIQKKIKESAAREQALFDRDEKTLLGTNKHPNPEERMKGELELYPFLKTKPRKTLIEPVIPRRLAETTEMERLGAE